MPRAFLIKGKADRKRPAALLGDENQIRNAQFETDFSNQGSEGPLTKGKTLPSRISTPTYMKKVERESQTGKRIFSESEEFAASQHVFESTMDGAQTLHARKTKEKKSLEVVAEEDGMSELPTKKRRKQQQPYHKVVYYYPLSEPEQIQDSEHESKLAPIVPHDMRHYANCYVNQGSAPRLSIHKQSDSSDSPGSEITQPCAYYHAPHGSTGAQASSQSRSRHNSDSRDESEKQLDFERLDRGLTEDELRERNKETREKQSTQYVVVEQRSRPKIVAESYSEGGQTTAEVEVQPTVQYIPLETRPNHDYKRQQIYTTAAEEAQDNSGVPEISSVGVLREYAPKSPTLNSSRSVSSSHTHSSTTLGPSTSYQPQTQAKHGYQPNVTTASYQVHSVVSGLEQRPNVPSYPPQLSPVTANYPPQASPVAASFPPQSTAFGYPPHPKIASAAYPLPQTSQLNVYPSQSSPVAPQQSSPMYKHHSISVSSNHTVVDTTQTEPRRTEPTCPPISSPKAAQTPPIVHYVPVYAIQSPSGEQKYVAGPPISNPPADPSKVIPPPPSVLEKYPSAPSIPQAVQQNAIAYPSSYRVRVASDPGPSASVLSQQAPQFQQKVPQPMQVPQPQRYPIMQPVQQPYPPPSQAYPQHLAQQPYSAQQPKPYQQPQQPLQYAPPQKDNQQRSKVYRVPEVCETARAAEREHSQPLPFQHIGKTKRTLKPKKNYPIEVVAPPNKGISDIPSSPDSLCGDPSLSESLLVKSEPSDATVGHLNGTSCVITPPGSPDDEESDSDGGETYTVVMRDQGMQTLPVKGESGKLADKTNSTRQIYFNNSSVRKHEVEQTKKVKHMQKENIYVENGNLPTMAVIVPRPSHMTPPDSTTQQKEEEKGLERYHCSFCSKGFQWHSHLKSHERTHTGEKPFKCSECGRCFTRADGLQCHMLVHNKKKPFKCQYCSKSFGESSQLEKHVYLHTGIKPFKCEYCGRAFSDSQSIEKHLLVHTGTKPFKCQYCVRSFNDSQMLVKHIRSHTGEKPFKCRNCTMAFSKQSALIIHNRVHTGEKPYQCPHCRKSFSISGNLQRHILIHTGERPYRCSKCPKAFNNPSHLSRHISKLHAPRTDDGPIGQVHDNVNASELELVHSEQ